MFLVFLTCNGQDSFLNTLYEIDISNKDTLSTKKIDSMFLDASHHISELNLKQKKTYLNNEYTNIYSSLDLNAFFVAYIEKEKYYSIFIKVIIGDSRHEIALVNINKQLRYIDSKIIHGGLHEQPEELENGNVRWYADNFSLLVGNSILYHDIQLYSESFYEDAKEWTEIKVDKHQISLLGKISDKFCNSKP